MTSEKYRKNLVSLVGVLAGLLVIGLVIVTLADGGHRVVGGPGSLFGWAVPLVALFIIVAVTWFLLVRDSRDSTEDDDMYVTCASCGHSILAEWRLCPYCGAQRREWDPAGRSLDEN
jgi:uncharacterized membrane protein